MILPPAGPPAITDAVAVAEKVAVTVQSAVIAPVKYVTVVVEPVPGGVPPHPLIFQIWYPGSGVTLKNVADPVPIDWTVDGLIAPLPTFTGVTFHAEAVEAVITEHRMNNNVTNASVTFDTCLPMTALHTVL